MRRGLRWDGTVGGPDFGILVGRFGLDASDPAFDPDLDHNGDGVLGGPDVGRYTSLFGLPVGPSGLACAGMPGCDATVVDLDGDGVVDGSDNCLVVPNPDQHDSNLDGFGNACDPDYDDDGSVTGADLAFFVCASVDPALAVHADRTGDGVVDLTDYLIFADYNGGAPAPSGLAQVSFDPDADSLADADAEGIANYQDNCRDVPNPDLLDPDRDGYGLACDADYDGDDDVDQDDYDAITAAAGLASGDPGFDADMDHDVDGSIDYEDVAFAGLRVGSPPCPRGTFCPPLPGSASIPVADEGFVRLHRGAEYRGVATASDPNDDPLTFALQAPPTAGTLESFDTTTGEFLYRSDPASSAAVDAFSFTAHDGVSSSEPAVVHIEYWEPADAPFGDVDLGDSTLVVCNENAQDALAIAQHYAGARNIDASRPCGVEMPGGLYAHRDELLAARDRIVASCICPAIPSAQRPSPCDAGNAEAVALASPITHLTLVRGLPARLYGTGWPTDSMEPSLDFYLSHLLYTGDDSFEALDNGAVEDGYARDASSLSYRRALDAGLHRRVAYGRIEAMTRGRTEDLVDRTLAAEAAGFSGNVFVEDVALFDVLRRRTGSLDPACGDPVLLGTPWQATCRTGTTATVAAGLQNGAVPGEQDSTIPVAVEAGLFLGSVYAGNGQRGFDGIDTLRRWHRSGGSCTELCADFGLASERDACSAASSDWFGELNTDCVGAAPGLIGMQLRSYPVTGYGFFPPGWRNGGSGHDGMTPPRTVESGGFMGGPFSDVHYLHFGTGAPGSPDASTCTRTGGAVLPCPEVIATHLETDVVLPAPLPVVGSRTFRVRVRHRSQSSPGARLRLRLRFEDTYGTQRWSSAATLDLTDGSESWLTSEVAIVATEALTGSDVAALLLEISADIGDGVRGWLDLDAVELVDDATGDALLEADVGGFAATPRETHLGDWAANAIDRLGAIGWWGSSSHHLTAGFAFANQQAMAGALLAGRTLGEAVAAAGRAESGIVYGDPLYRPSAAALFFASDEASKVVAPLQGSTGVSGRVVEVEDLPTYRYLYMNVLHGTANLDTVQWSLSTCPGLDELYCDAQGLWSFAQSGQGAVLERPIDWSAELIDGSQDQLVTIRLRVWNPSEESRALYDFVRLDYRAGTPYP